MKFLKEAVELAQNDNIYLPFIENIYLIKPVLEIGFSKQNGFINNIYEYEKLYGMRFKMVRQNDYVLHKEKKK